MTSAGFLDLQNDLLTWQTSYVWVYPWHNRAPAALLSDLEALHCAGAMSFNEFLYYIILLSLLLRCSSSPGKVAYKGSINLNPLAVFFAEFMPVGSECEEELQKARGLPQLETCLQHGPEHVCPSQVRTPTGECSQSLADELHADVSLLCPL